MGEQTGLDRVDDHGPPILPNIGADLDSVVDELVEMRHGDIAWSQGRAFGLVYDGGHQLHRVAERAAAMFLHDNALNTNAIPSLGRIQRDVVGWTAGLMHGDAETAGFMTSGGTESIQCAVLAARERARTERGIEHPEIVVAESAHAAFHKSAHMYRMPIRTVGVCADWTVDLDQMRAAIGPHTALVVGSAPQYPQGVVDPIPEIADLAAQVGANCHVDACMGGFVLPFAEMLGRDVVPWDFRVDGVHSISADIHKLGYAPKGASVIVYRNRQLRRHQTFVFSDWLGGLYASPNLQGTRSGAPMAAAWAVMRHLGQAGYVELTRIALETADRLRGAVEGIEELRTLADAQHHLVAVAAQSDLDVFALGDALAQRGWHIDRQTPPDTLHHTVSFGNAPVIEDYIADLSACAEAVKGQRAAGRSTDYATLE